MSQFPFREEEGQFNNSKLRRLLNIWRVEKYPSLSQFRRFLKILTKKEKVAFFAFLSLFLASLLSLSIIIYFKNTDIKPAPGSVFIEGVVGQPRFINPIYSSISDVDQDLVELIFSGLLKYDKDAKIVPDLAESYEIKNDGKVYEVHLKKNLFWSDGKPLIVDDVIFTIDTIQNSYYKSPQIASWLGVEVEKISDSGVRFSLKNPYNSFLENLTQKIIPQHIFKDIGYENFPLTIYNLKPIGSGPYKLKEIKQDKLGKIISLALVRNQKYSGKTPYLNQISFRFFNSEDELIKAAQKKEIQGFSIIDQRNYNLFEKTDFQDLRLSLPRYFAVFFNPEKSEVLNDINVRQALNYGLDKTRLIQEALSGYGKEIFSPVLPEIYGLSEPTEIYAFNPDLAKNLLEKVGFLEKENGIREKNIKKEPVFQFKTDLREGAAGKDVEFLQQCLAKDPAVYPEARITGEFGSQTKKAVIRFQEKYAKDILEPFGLSEGTGSVLKGTREKLNQICFPPPPESLTLKFSLVTVNQPVLIKVANLLKEQWQSLGADVSVETFDISELEKNIIKTRNYESLLFGEILGALPDPFPFWHSTQRKDPGLNLAIYQNKSADRLLEDIRQISDTAERKQKLEQFQEILTQEAPAIFLYSPDYVYFVDKKIKGVIEGVIVQPSKRLANIENWYINTKRTWK